MAGNVLVDASFLIALFCRNDKNHAWAAARARLHPPPWISCESVLSEADHLLAPDGCSALRSACRRGAVRIVSTCEGDMLPVLSLMDKYSDVPMSIADACLVRLSEVLTDPLILTTDTDFRIYRRHGRKVIPCEFP